jgi:hypothetical protein
LVAGGNNGLKLETEAISSTLMALSCCWGWKIANTHVNAIREISDMLEVEFSHLSF